MTDSQIFQEKACPNNLSLSPCLFLFTVYKMIKKRFAAYVAMKEPLSNQMSTLTARMGWSGFILDARSVQLTRK
uniref:Uncharacterized protein n=1 Tax=Steinernema glaseri TaxID=37863 RepID=A0A1I7YSN4_9BILA